MKYPPYFLESSLPFRVREYMEENKKIHIEEMTDYLIYNYKDFNRKKKKSFMKSVVAAYEWELSQSLSKNASSDPVTMKSNEIFRIDREESPDIVEISATETKKKKNENRKSDTNFFIDGLYKLSSPPSHNGLSDSRTLKQKEDTPRSNKNLKRKRKVNDIEELQSPLPKIHKKSIARKLIPTETLSDFYGLEEAPFFLGVLSLDKFMRKVTGPHLPKAAFISGPIGSGKTMLMKCLAGELGVPLYQISATSLCVGAGVDSEVLLTELKSEILSEAPCILLIEEMGYLYPKGNGDLKKSESKLVEDLIKFITEITTKYANRYVLPVIKSRSRKIDSGVLALLTQKIIIPALNKKTKILLLKKFMTEVGWISSDVDFDVIAERATSYLAGDLKELASLAGLKAGERVTYNEIKEILSSNEICKNYHEYYGHAPKVEINMEVIMAAMNEITPTLKENKFPRPSKVKWEDVQGLEDVKEMIFIKIIDPIKNPQKYELYGLNNPNSLLLYGPPGCGKTFLAQAIANKAGINLLSVKGPEFLSMYQGESERKVREIFQTAESVAPCIIFFDEFDSLCPKRSGNTDNGSKHSIVNTLLVEMDGFGEKPKVYVIAASNRPDTIDPAILRPGRIETKLYVGFPDEKGRADILQSSLKKAKIAVDSDVNFEEIAQWLKNFSAADCSGLFRASMEEAVKEDSLLPCRKHFEKAFSSISASVSLEEQKIYLDMQAKYERSKK